jgi:hypothetical protein
MRVSQSRNVLIGREHRGKRDRRRGWSSNSSRRRKLEEG